MATGICYTQSGNVKKYEAGELTYSPDKVKLVGHDNIISNVMITMIFTPASHPPDVSLEDGTVMYVTQVDHTNVDLSDYISYEPPEGYELVSESHKNDKGVKEYIIERRFNYEPYTVFYGTATKSFTDYETATKHFYYKEKKVKPKPNTYFNYYIIFTVSNGQLRCQCSGVSDIPGTDNGNFTLQVGLTITDSHDPKNFSFSWVMKDGIDESQSCIGNIYCGGGFNTQNSWEKDNGDGTKTYYTFLFDTSSLVNGLKGG